MTKKYVVIGIQPIEHRATIFAESEEQALKKAEEGPVSYTHLTLPTILLV